MKCRYQPFVFLGLILAVTVLTGCGYDPSEPPYDTKANPEGFPDQALRLLDGIESGKLASLEQISGAFADLYTDSSEMLDNKKWRAIIDRLGLRLRFLADREAAKGVVGYSQASDYYQLAAFARPGDETLAHLSRLYAPWKRLGGNRLVSAFEKGASPAELVAVLKRFYFGDSTAVRFFTKVLIHQCQMDPNTAENMSAADRAFLVSVGLTDQKPQTQVVDFGHGMIRLVAAAVETVDSATQRVELYFTSDRVIADMFTVVIHIPTTDPGVRSPAVEQHFLSLEIEPQPPVQQWQPGELYALSRSFHFLTRPHTIDIGLRKSSDTSGTFLSSSQGNGRFCRIEPE